MDSMAVSLRSSATSESPLAARFAALRDVLSATIVGQPALVERPLIALLADGHCLWKAPGLAKTTPLKPG